MKKLTEKIIEKLEIRMKENMQSDNYVYRCALLDSISIVKELSKSATFEELSRELMDFIGNYHPHTKIILTNTTSEILEGVETVGVINDYVRDKKV